MSISTPQSPSATIPSGIEVHDNHAPYAPALIDAMYIATTRHFSLGFGLGSGLLGQLRAEVRAKRMRPQFCGGTIGCTVGLNGLQSATSQHESERLPRHGHHLTRGRRPRLLGHRRRKHQTPPRTLSTRRPRRNSRVSSVAVCLPYLPLSRYSGCDSPTHERSSSQWELLALGTPPLFPGEPPLSIERNKLAN